MKIAFITIGYPLYNIYTDLMKEFDRHGHQVYIICTNERRNGLETRLADEDGLMVLRVKCGNITKNSNLIDKAISLLRLEGQMIGAVKKYLNDVHFDLIIYSAPPVTLNRVILYLKKRDRARTYLLLKDIFPQNAVDIGVMKGNGLIYQYFKAKERMLYRISDYIGCMSPANVQYLLRHEPDLSPEHVEVCPNSIQPEMRDVIDKEAVRLQYSIPIDKTVFLYGGNLGKPQGIEFLMRVLESQNDHGHAYFLIVGSGTEYPKLERFIAEKNLKNVKLYSFLPKGIYDQVVQASDVGMIFLDPRFTIPNFPSRLLSYMECSLPVIAATDDATDLGEIIQEGGFGLWCKSGELQGFSQIINQLVQDQSMRRKMGKNAHQYLIDHYEVGKSYEIIMNHFEGEE